MDPHGLVAREITLSQETQEQQEPGAIIHRFVDIGKKAGV
jgi:hypothetical protein